MSVHQGEKLQKTLKDNHLSVADFARQIGTPRQSLYNIFKMEVLDKSFYQKLTSALQLPDDYFSHDTISTLMPVKKPAASFMDNAFSDNPDSSSDDMVSKLTDLKSKNVKSDTSIIDKAFEKNLIQFLPLVKKRDYDSFAVFIRRNMSADWETTPVMDTPVYGGELVMEVSGDSMAPTLHSGSEILVRPVDKNNWKYIEAGIYAVVYGNMLSIKRIRERNWWEGYLRLYADNPLFGYVDVEVTDIHALYKATDIVRQKLS
jgi:transcriptional regulator with XRE-family HTH domain